jgi:L-iditol 2-dehydrogenase
VATIKAVVYHAPQDIRVEAIPMPACGANEIRVAVDACAVCGTDLKTWRAGNPRIQPPKVMGHEFTGLIETVGNNVRGFAVGERVVMATSVSCGQCLYCRKGWRNLCVDLAAMGFAYPGGMAEFVTIPSRALEQGHVVKVPLAVKASHAALAEPISCAINAAENCGIAQGDTVAVLGAGPMGILNACVARQFGAARIILSELNPLRLKQAQALGFERLVDPAAEDLGQAIKQETGGYGADVVIVAAPAAQPQEQAISLVRKHGTVCLFASLPAGRSTLTFDSRPLHYGELRLVGTSDSTPAQVARAVDMIARGVLPADRIASHLLKLDDILKAYALMESGEALRVVLTP